MMKIKILDVYCGYGEMGIEFVKEIEGESIEKVVKKLVKENCKGLKKGDREFFESYEVKNSVEGSLSFGEEMCMVVLGEGSRWFNFNERYEKSGEEEWKEWCNFVGGFKV